MRSESDSEYYRRRAEQERECAEAAPDEAIRGLHLELMRRYQALADDDKPKAA
jgi:hypothetical protein